MVSLENCRKILTKNGENYTMEEIKSIKFFLDGFADIIIESKLKTA
tara:strand:- start:731 stop:868 length:138 start_codon:yes stop_codon:yes gene_type:complete